MTSKITDKQRKRLHAIPGVTGVFTGKKTVGGVETDTTAIVITVAEKKPRSDIPNGQVLPTEIDGVPTDVIQEIIRPYVVDAVRYDPLQGGVSTSSRDGHFWGTLGMIATDIASGDPVAVSCHHVFLERGGNVGDYVLQPSWYFGGVNDLDTCGFVLRGELGGSVDASAVKILNRAYINEIQDIGEITGIGAATVSMSVSKRGATTELTTGTVAAIDASTLTHYADPIGDINFTNVIRVTGAAGMSLPGDSGSAFVSGSTVVGILFAGNEDGSVAYASPIGDVFAALGLEVYTPITGVAIVGNSVGIHSTLLHVNKKTDYLDDWELFGIISFDCPDSRIRIGLGNPTAMGEEFAYVIEFKGPTHSSVPFKLYTPSGSLAADGDPFKHREQITFRLGWKTATHTLSAEAQQGDSPLVSLTLIEPSIPTLNDPYKVVVAGTRDVDGNRLTVGEIFELTLSRECGTGDDLPAGMVWTTDTENNGTVDTAADMHFISAAAGGISPTAYGAAHIDSIATGGVLDCQISGYFELGGEDWATTISLLGDMGNYDIEFNFVGNAYAFVSPHRSLGLIGFGSDDGAYTNFGIPSFVALNRVDWVLTFNPTADTLSLELSQGGSSWSLVHNDTDWQAIGDTDLTLLGECFGKNNTTTGESIISVQDVTLL